jgi:hypothetical protein
MEESNPRLGEAIEEVVLNQINDNNPPITKATYERLVSEGYEKDEALRLIACVVSTEIFNMLKKKEPFHPQNFEKMMKKLPKMPWD